MTARTLLGCVGALLMAATSAIAQPDSLWTRSYGTSSSEHCTSIQLSFWFELMPTGIASGVAPMEPAAVIDAIRFNKPMTVAMILEGIAQPLGTKSSSGW